MRAFFTLFVAAACVLSANAGVIDKRDVSQTCVNSINSLNNQLTVINQDILAFIPADGTAGVSKIGNGKVVLQGYLQTANQACCSIVPTDAKGDSALASTAINAYAVNIFTTLSSMESKKLGFDQVPGATEGFKGHLTALSTDVGKLYGCLVTNSSPDFLKTATDLQKSVADAFTKAITTFTAPK